MPLMKNILARKDSGTDVTYFPVSDTPKQTWRTNLATMALDGQFTIEYQTETLKGGKARSNLKITQPIMSVVPFGTVNAAGYTSSPTLVGSEAISITLYRDTAHGTSETIAGLLRQAAHVLSGASHVSGAGVTPKDATSSSFRDIPEDSAVLYSLVNNLSPY